MTDEYIFARNTVMTSRTQTAPAINNTFNAVVIRIDIFARVNPVMMYVKYDRNKIGKFQACVKIVCDFFIFDCKCVTCFGA